MENETAIKSHLAEPFTLPSGITIPNRLVKSAMNENLAPELKPTELLNVLYERWGAGGVGISITGNVMVDRNHLGGAGQLVIEDERDLEGFTEMAARAQANGSKLFMQINHPGRQSPADLNPEPLSPSDVTVAIGGRVGGFNKPKALTVEEIQDIIRRFGVAAGVAKKAGFSGVQIHGAHGYLVSQFLSPISNVRTDEWGGSIENRMRFACEVFKSMRAAVGPDFAIGIKLNSADFQKGGFTEEESMTVVKTLADLGLDLLEISGGTYEATAMMGSQQKESTVKREAYFLDYAAKVRELVKIPLLLTGGFRTKQAMEDAIAEGHIDFAGMGRPFAEDANIATKLLSGESDKSTVVPLDAGKFSGAMEMAWYELQMDLLARGQETNPEFNMRNALRDMKDKDRRIKKELRNKKKAEEKAAEENA